MSTSIYPQRDKEGQHLRKNLIFTIWVLFAVLAGCSKENVEPKEPYQEIEPPRPDWVEFYKEKVPIVCFDDETQIDGTFYFRNVTKGELALTIQFPFPVDEYHPFPHEIVVEGYEHWGDESNIYWNMSFRPGEEKAFNVFYKQKALNKSAAYILTSVPEFWRTPIDTAQFVISVPIEWKKVRISSEPDKTEVRDGRRLYFITRSSFSPQENLVISWE